MSVRFEKSKSRRRVAAALEARVAVAVVQLARLGLREHLVRLGDRAKARLRVRLLGDVRVQLARELAERLLDLGVARPPLDAEQLVVVAFRRRHRSKGTGDGQSSSYATSTRRESS